MELEKVRNWNNEIVVQPVRKRDIPLFMHCAGGGDTFSSKFYKKELEPVLIAHGAKYIHITDRSRK